MDPLTITAIATAISTGLTALAQKLADKTVVDPALDAAADRLQPYIPGLGNADAQALQGAVRRALTVAGAPEDEDDVARWLKNVSLDRLVAPGNDALRRQMARAIVAFVDPSAKPPEDLVVALGWPRSQTPQLAHLLGTLRAHLATLDDWQPLIEYADRADARDLLQRMLRPLAQLDNVFVHTAAGEALRHS